ncbi:hypothetical protein HDU98_002288 [Podochytrium sp. JEL0797]|nr:hypothetical protein HDU98_002288 [Podochytrium sp. JEL0797]
MKIALVATAISLLAASASGEACPFLSARSNAQGASMPALHRRSVAAPASHIDYSSVKADIKQMFTNSTAFWPADYGNYAPLMIRLAWHCSGSHRQSDGRGGCDGARIRFNPEHSWPDNVNLDKALRLLTPVKDKHPEISWGDLIVLTGNTAIESMGGPTMGFCGGRVDATDGNASILLGPTAQQEQDQPCLVNGNCTLPFGPTTIGLIYVNPEGPMANPDPVGSALQIRTIFGNMGFNDSETVALIGGGHAFGKTHGACKTGAGPSPLEDPTNPWPGTCGVNGTAMFGKGENTFSSGFEGAWSTTPTVWSNQYFTNLLGFNWTLFMGPGGHNQWKPSESVAPDVRMLTADVALLHDVDYLGWVKTYAGDVGKLQTDFAAAWYKLTTEDMGPQGRCVNSDAPPAQAFQNPVPAPPAKLANFTDVSAAVGKLFVGKPEVVAQVVDLAYQCASTFRATDYRGGCNGARIRFEPEKGYPENRGLDTVLTALEPVKAQFGDALTWADLIAVAGKVALVQAGVVGVDVSVGRSDAMDGSASKSFPPRNYYTSVEVQVADDATVRGLSVYEAVALAGRPRSSVLQVARGLKGSYAPDLVGNITNAYFQLLLSEKWVNVEGAPGVLQAEGKKDVFMMDTDVALLNVPAFKAVVVEFAANQTSFTTQLAGAWSYLMNADMQFGSAGGSENGGGSGGAASPTASGILGSGALGRGVGGWEAGVAVVAGVVGWGL